MIWISAESVTILPFSFLHPPWRLSFQPDCSSWAHLSYCGCSSPSHCGDIILRALKRSHSEVALSQVFKQLTLPHKGVRPSSLFRERCMDLDWRHRGTECCPSAQLTVPLGTGSLWGARFHLSLSIWSPFPGSSGQEPGRKCRLAPPFSVPSSVSSGSL